MEGKKKILIFLMVCFLATNAFAGITNYEVPSSVPLNQRITATGKSLDDSNAAQVNQLCSFYFFDDSGNLVSRASDQYTDQTGRFAMIHFVLTEPDFQRGKQFTLKAVCGSSEADGNFVVEQKQDVVGIYPQGVITDIAFWNDPNNSIIFVGFMFFILLVIGSAYLITKSSFSN